MNMSERDLILRKLQRFLPHLQLARDFYRTSSPQESLKIAGLINIIKNDGGLLPAESLKGWECFCKSLYKKFDKEFDRRINKQSNSPPASSKPFVVDSSTSALHNPHSTPRGLNCPVTFPPHQQQNNSQTSPSSSGAARRKDSLLSNVDSRTNCPDNVTLSASSIHESTQTDEEENKLIPLNLVEEIIKKNLPKGEADKLLDFFKSKSNEREKATSSRTAESLPSTSTSQNADATVTSSGDVKKGKSLLPRKIARHNEDSTDFLKDDSELGSRSRAIQSSSTKQINSADYASSAKPELAAQGNKKRKVITASEISESTSVRSPPLKKSKGPDTGYDSEQGGENETIASDDEQLKCKICSKRVKLKGIIDHYVNEHPFVEISFVKMPEKEWKAISSQNLTNVPANHKVNPDLSWIPPLPSFTSPVQCTICSFITNTQSELIEHVLVHALPTNCKYRCVLCGFIKTGIFDMLDHIAGHTGEFRYHCNYCDVRFSYLSDIKSHMKLVHESLNGLCYTPADSGHLWIYGFVCKTCHYVQMTEERLLRHLDLNEKCDGFTKVSLIELVQTEPEREIEILKPENSVFCELSIVLERVDDIKPTQSKRLNGKDGFQEDKIPCKPDNPALGSAKEKCENKHQGLSGRQLYICGNIGCKETAETRVEFKDHLLSCVFAPDTRVFKCRHCGSYSKHVFRFLKHLRTHGIRRYLCGLCSYGSYFPCDVRRHMNRIHHVASTEEVVVGPGPDLVGDENVIFELVVDVKQTQMKRENREDGIKKAKIPGKPDNPALDLSKLKSEEHQEGLYGSQLYVCGNVGCNTRVETAAKFEGHLLACGLSRDPEVFTCHHCGIFRQSVSKLISHLRVHSLEKRFFCGLCPYRSYFSRDVLRHMKGVHGVTVVDEVVVGRHQT